MALILKGSLAGTCKTYGGQGRSTFLKVKVHPKQETKVSFLCVEKMSAERINACEPSGGPAALLFLFRDNAARRLVLDSVCHGLNLLFCRNKRLSEES